jgi:hypothetical protein
MKQSECGRTEEQQESLLTAGGGVNWYSHFENTNGVLKLNICTS